MDDIDARGEDRECVDAAARAATERDREAMAIYKVLIAVPRRPMTELQLRAAAAQAYRSADAFLAERARRRAEGGR